MHDQQLVWFVVLAVPGLRGIARETPVHAAFDPGHALVLSANYALAGFLSLGAVFLMVTGGEALYTDP